MIYFSSRRRKIRQFFLRKCSVEELELELRKRQTGKTYTLNSGYTNYFYFKATPEKKG